MLSRIKGCFAAPKDAIVVREIDIRGSNMKLYGLETDLSTKCGKISRVPEAYKDMYVCMMRRWFDEQRLPRWATRKVSGLEWLDLALRTRRTRTVSKVAWLDLVNEDANGWDALDFPALSREARRRKKRELALALARERVRLKRMERGWRV